VGLKQQVFRWVTREDEFGKCDEVRPAGFGAFDVLDYPFGIPFEVANGWVDLSKCNAN
jgi:hypothetical protein